MLRFIERNFGQYLPFGYPIDTDPVIISTIDNYVRQTKHITMIMVKRNNFLKINYQFFGKTTIYENISFEDIKNKLIRFLADYKVTMFDDSWAKSNIGYFIRFEADKNIEINIRLFGLDETEIKELNEIYKNSFIKVKTQININDILKR